MARNRYEEAIRLYVETAGDEQLKALVAELDTVEGASKQTETALAAMLGELSDTQRLQRAAEGYRQLGEQVIGLNRDYNAARTRVEELANEMASVEKPTKAQERAFSSARAELERLGRELGTSRGKYSGLKTDLEKAGVAGKTYADTLGRIADRQQSANAKIKQFITDTVNARKAATDLAARRADFTRFMGDGADKTDEAARAMDLYRKKVAAAAAENEKLKRSAKGTAGVFDGIRGAVAGVAAVFGFREAATGVFNLLKVSAAAEDARRSLGNLYGSQAEGNRAFKALEQIAKSNGLAFNDVVDQARKLKSFGLDPLNGSLQALIDQNSAVGGSMQDLEGKVLALGQAWAKQKLQGEEILQLVERGVPVWDLLQKVTGKNVAELQKLSEQGKLGRDVISALYTELGKANAGAAEAGLSSINGLLAQGRARWVEFQQAVGNAGLTNYFKQQISQLLGSTSDLDGVAKRVAQSIIGVIEGVKQFAIQLAPIGKAVAGITGFLATHAGTVAQVVKAYTALLVVRTVLPPLAAFRESMISNALAAEVAGKKVHVLNRTLNAIPTDVRIALAIVGYDAVLGATAELTNQLTKNSQAIQAAGIAGRALREELYQGAVAFRAVAAANAQYKDTALLTAEELASASNAEREAYAARLAGLLEYQKAQSKFLIGFNAIGVATRAQVTELEGLQASLKLTRKALNDLADGMESGAFRAKSAAQTFAEAAGNSFDDLIAKGETAREAVGKIFDNVDLTKPAQLEKALAAFDSIAGKSDQAAEAIRAQLRSELAKLSDEDLPRVRGAAEYVFGQSGRKMVGEFANAIKSINLTQLGVDMEYVRTGIYRATRVAIDQFSAARKEVKALGLDSVQSGRAITQAFDNAFKDVRTSKEIDAIRKELQAAVTDGSLGFVEYNSRINELNKKMRALRDEAAGVGTDLDRSAQQGSTALDDLGAAARKAAEDVAKVGEKGKESGDETEKGMDKASAAARSFSGSLDGVSQKFIELAQSRAVNFRELGQSFVAQQKSLQEEIASLDAQNAKYDEMAQRRKELRDKYPLVSEDTVDKLLSTEKTLADNRKRVADAAAREAEDSRKAAEEALAASHAAEADRAKAGLQTVEVIRIEVVAARDSGLVSGTGVVDPAAADRIARAVLGRIERARSGSNRRNRTR